MKKNLRITTLILCALIGLAPIQANAFSFGSLAHHVRTFSALGLTCTANLIHGAAKKIKNNPWTTTGIIGAGALLVATVFAAKRNNVSFSMKTGNQNPWTIAFTGERFPYTQWKDEEAPSRPSTPSSSTNSENGSVHSERKSPPHTPPTPPTPLTPPLSNASEINNNSNLNEAAANAPKGNDSSDILENNSHRSNCSLDSLLRLSVNYSSSLLSDLPDNLSNPGSIGSMTNRLSHNPYTDSSYSHSSIRSTKRLNGSVHQKTNKDPIKPIIDQQAINSSIEQFDKKLLQRRISSPVKQYLNNWTGTLKRQGSKTQDSLRHIRSSMDMSEKPNNRFIVFNVETIKKWIENENKNALLNMKLSNELEKYQNLAKLVEQIKLLIIENNKRMEQLESVALQGKTMDLQQALRPLVIAIANSQAFDNDPSQDEGLNAWLATLAKNPEALLAEVPTEQLNEEPLTLIKWLYNDYDNCSRKHFGIQQRLSNIRWLYNTQTPSVKKAQLEKALQQKPNRNKKSSLFYGIKSRLRKTQSNPYGASSSSS